MTRLIKRRYATVDLKQEIENGLDPDNQIDVMAAAISHAKAIHPKWHDDCKWRLLWIQAPKVKLCRESRD